MSNHTKGPWEFHAHGGSVSVKGQPHNSICEGILKEGQQVLGADYANANLIAAAPELYESLAWAMKYVKQVRIENPLPTGCGEDIAYAEAVAALAKARGES